MLKFIETKFNLGALTYRDAAQFDRAIALFEQTLATRSTKLGPDHPYTLLIRRQALSTRRARI